MIEVELTRYAPTIERWLIECDARSGADEFSRETVEEYALALSARPDVHCFVAYQGDEEVGFCALMVQRWPYRRVTASPFALVTRRGTPGVFGALARTIRTAGEAMGVERWQLHAATEKLERVLRKRYGGRVKYAAIIELEA